MKIIGVYCDKDINLKVIKDDFETIEKAESYMRENNMSGEEYFVAEVD